MHDNDHTSNLNLHDFDVSRSSSSIEKMFNSSSQPISNTHLMVTRAKTGVFKPKVFHITSTTPHIEAANMKEVITNLAWFRSMQTNTMLCFKIKCGHLLPFLLVLR